MPIPLKLLLLEDDLLDAELNVAALEAEGFQCTWQRVQTKQEFLDALAHPNFDLILVDYNLPGFDGLQAMQLLSASNLDIPAIFVTGNLKTELAIESIKAGAVDFVHKDRLARLAPSVKRALEETELRHQNKMKEADLGIFYKLNQAANKGATLQELADILAKNLPLFLQCSEVSIYLLNTERDALFVYNTLADQTRYKKIEKILGITIPAMELRLGHDTAYEHVLRKKEAQFLQEREEIDNLLKAYLQLAPLPNKIRKKIEPLLPKIAPIIAIEAVWIIPLITGEQCFGLLELSYRNREKKDELERLDAILEQITAIFARKLAEEENNKLHHQQKKILDSAAEGILGIDKEGRHIFVNPAAAQILGYEIDELLHEKNHQLYHRHTPEEEFGDAGTCSIFSPSFRERETIFLNKDGKNLPISYTSSLIVDDGEMIGVVLAFRDISKQLETTREIARLAQVVEQTQVSVGITDLNGNLIYTNPFFTIVSGYTKDELLGSNPRVLKSGFHNEIFYENLWKHLASGKTWQGKLVNKKKDGSLYHEDAIIFPIKTDENEIINYATVKREISAEVAAQERIQKQVSQLESLHLIDTAILTSMDLSFVIDVITRQAQKELNIDAIDLLLFDPVLQSFSCISRFGFRTNALEFTNLRLGKGLAGRAALTRKTIRVDDLSELQKGAPQLASEKFQVYYGVPLVAKEELKGVLEIFMQSSFVPDDQWLKYLNTIAGQAAIAIENAELFKNLRKRNDELSFSYEATLEGWARALELHDMETEGHSRRVVDLTTRLARLLGLDESMLVHVRRGALLHDIGKLAIPERILNKKGPFNPEEKELMQKHTLYGIEMLAEIPFLEPALDIPASHHEKWDGSGYPLGLSGTAIPFPARIFAIIDVYDALINDRPYRLAWSREKVFEYLKAESGKHFDPNVVHAFFELPEMQ